MSKLPRRKGACCITTALAASSIKLLAEVIVGIPAPELVIESAEIESAIILTVVSVSVASLYINPASPPNEPESLNCTCVSAPPGVPPPPPPEATNVIASPLVVIVILAPATKVNVSVVVSATTSD